MQILERAITKRLMLRKLPTPALRRLLREQLGLSQQTLAEAVGVTRETISRWENGEREPTRGDHAERYLEALEYLVAQSEQLSA